MAYISKRGSTWHVRYYVGKDPVTGKKIQRSKGGFRTKKEAERFEREVEASLDNNTYIEPYLISAALDVLEEDLKDTEDKQLRQKAAIHILQAVGLYGQSLKPDGEDTPEGVEAQKRHEEAFKELTMLG